MKKLAFKSMWLSSVLILALGSIFTASAQSTTQDSGWQFAAELYFWGASIGGETAAGTDIDVELDDILDSLEFAFMGAAGIRKGRWSLIADAIYLNVEDSATVAPGIDASVELTNWVVTPFLAYSLLDTEKGRFDILGGARYLYLKADLSIGPFSGDDSGANWDGIIGARGEVNLSPNWFLFAYGDVGTGDSDVTWQGFGGLGYRFKRIELVAAYRYLRWDFDDETLIDDLNIHGPAVGIRVPF
jgi:hypothetical protein